MHLDYMSHNFPSSPSTGAVERVLGQVVAAVGGWLADSLSLLSSSQ